MGIIHFLWNSWRKLCSDSVGGEKNRWLLIIIRKVYVKKQLYDLFKKKYGTSSQAWCNLAVCPHK